MIFPSVNTTDKLFFSLSIFKILVKYCGVFKCWVSVSSVELVGSFFDEKFFVRKCQIFKTEIFAGEV